MNPVTDYRESWREAARSRPRRILLPEGDDPRILQAASIANEMGVCQAEVMGDAAAVNRVWRDNKLEGNLPPLVSLPAAHDQFDALCEDYAELRAKAEVGS